MTDLERLIAEMEVALDDYAAKRAAYAAADAAYDAALDDARARYHNACVRYHAALAAQTKEQTDDA